MAKWKEFAQMLGLELNEKFKIKQNGEVYEELYRFTEKGLQWLSEDGDWQTPNDTPEICELIKGEAEVIKMPWKPKIGNTYWLATTQNDRVFDYCWFENYYDLCSWKIGNCFKTKEEAETKGKEIVERIKKEFING